MTDNNEIHIKHISNQRMLCINEHRVMALGDAIRELCAALFIVLRVCEDGATVSFEGAKLASSKFYGLGLRVQLGEKSVVVVAHTSETKEHAVAVMDTWNAVFSRMAVARDKGEYFLMSCFQDSSIKRNAEAGVALIRILEIEGILSEAAKSNIPGLAETLQAAKVVH